MSENVLTFPVAPDLGPVKTVNDDSVEGGVLINVAGVVELARNGRTPQARRIYREFCKTWDVVKDGPGTEGDKQFMALRHALTVIGLNISAPTSDLACG